MKVPYIVVQHKPNVLAIHADEYKGTFDRKYYWEKLILPPVLRLIQARFPGYSFSDFKQPLQGQFDFSNQAMTSRKVPKQVTAKKIVRKVKKIKKPVKQLKSDIYTLTIPSHAGIPTIKGIAKLAKAFPGRYKLAIVIDIKRLGAEVDISTEQYVSMECLREIKNTFPQVQIEPKPL
jgi:hypothetical protein